MTIPRLPPMFYRYFSGILTSLFYLMVQPAASGQEVYYVEGSSQKIEQLVGDWDNQRGTLTHNRTNVRYGINATDLGVPFQHNGQTYVAFGDISQPGYDRDPLAYTTDTIPEDGIALDFIANEDGSHRPVDIPGVSLKGFEVPMEGVSWNGDMYLYATTDVMTRSVLAKSTDNGYNFTKLYDVSSRHFINISLVKTHSTSAYPEPEQTPIQVMLGSGMYRESDVYLAYQRGDEIEAHDVHYFTGTDGNDLPLWSTNEEDALALFDQPCVGELSLSYNKFIKKWILLYNCGTPRGINCRVANDPWGPWSEPFVIFDPVADHGYCYFIHSNWDVNKCDEVMDPGREYEWGGEYGPYQFEELATGNPAETTIYYTLSTWNPYTVVLMKSKLRTTNYIATGIDDTEEPHFTLYPNPAGRQLNVTFDEDLGSGTLTLENLTGLKLMSLKVGAAEQTMQVELSDRYIPGIYIMHYYPDNGRHDQVRKLVIY